MRTDDIRDNDVLAGKIQLIASKIKSDPNPEELDQLKRLVKKNVPFTLRGYFAAYLLRELENQSKDRKPAPKKDRMDRPQRPARKEERKDVSPAKENSVAPQARKSEAHAERPARNEGAPRVDRPIPEGAKTLYLNVGKMKRLYAKDLSRLLQTELGITRDDIFALRIHDKYSFITMSEENCEKAIATLNGKDINGRVAQINYSNRDQATSGNGKAEKQTPEKKTYAPQEEENANEAETTLNTDNTESAAPEESSVIEETAVSEETVIEEKDAEGEDSDTEKKADEETVEETEEDTEKNV